MNFTVSLAVCALVVIFCIVIIRTDFWQFVYTTIRDLPKPVKILTILTFQILLIVIIVLEIKFYYLK